MVVEGLNSIAPKTKKAMDDAILHEQNNNDKARQKARKKLYEVLHEDEELSELIRWFSFDQFSNAIDHLKANYRIWSKKGSYIPVCAFCYYLPLSMAVDYYLDDILSSWESFQGVLDKFFDLF